MHAFHQSAFQNIAIIIITLLTWKKNRYKLQKSIFSDLETEIQQKNIEKDLHLTNEKICELNNAIGVSNIRWDKSVCKTKTKKRGRMGTNKSVVCVYNYDGFYDGVHPNLTMADK